MAKQASGTFEVKLAPQAEDKGEGSSLGRMSIDKQFQGDLEGTSKGEMLTAMTEVKGSAGYVAIERVSGTLPGPPEVCSRVVRVTVREPPRSMAMPSTRTTPDRFMKASMTGLESPAATRISRSPTGNTSTTSSTRCRNERGICRLSNPTSTASGWHSNPVLFQKN